MKPQTNIINQSNQSQLMEAINEYFKYFKIKDRCALKQLIDQDSTCQTEYFLITGQSFVNWLLPVLKSEPNAMTQSIESQMKISRSFNRFINDIDIFSVKRSVHCYTQTDTIEQVDVNNYGSLSNVSYSILNSNKINIDDTLYNFIDIQDLLFHIKYEDVSTPQKQYASAKNILGFFDTNFNQIGAYYNAETDDIKLIWTNDFNYCMTTNQIELNPKSVQIRRFYRLYYKFEAIKQLNLVMMFEQSTDKNLKFYTKISEFAEYAAILIKLVKTSKEYIESEEVADQFEHTILGELNEMIFSHYRFEHNNQNRYIYERIINKIIDSYTIKFNPSESNYVDKSDIKFTQEFQKRIDSTEIKYMDLKEFIIKSVANSGYITSDKVFNTLHVTAITELSLQRMSQVKLKALIKYMTDHNFKNLPFVYLILTYNPKLINRSVSEFYRVVLNSVHFPDIFQKYHDTELVFDFIIDMMNAINLASETQAINLKTDKLDLVNTLYGIIESNNSYIKFLEEYIIYNKNLDKINSAINNIIEKQIKVKYMTKLIDLPKLKIATNGYVIEELTYEYELKSEGSHLTHCVAGYSRAVHRGESIILRVYKNTPYHPDDKYNFRYTVELRYNEILNKYDIIQIRGYRNKSAEEAHLTIINSLIEQAKEQLMLSDDRTKFHTKKLEVYSQPEPF